MSFITISAGNRLFELEVAPHAGAAENLLQTVYLSGLFEPPPLCAGIALCGRCRLRFLSPPPPPLPEDIKALGQRAVEQGWRLGCRHKAVPGARIELPPGIGALRAADLPPAAPGGGSVSLAVDFGSTSLCWVLHYNARPDFLSGTRSREPGRAGSEFRLARKCARSAAAIPGGASRAHDVEPGGIDGGCEGDGYKGGRCVNPQMGAGSDIISRLAYARRPGGADRLASLSRAALARMVAETGPVGEICLAANPAMTCLLLGKDISGLAAAPYRLSYRGGRHEHLPGLPPIWVAPLVGPFLGGDLSAGYAALALGGQAAYPFVLADLGTNGEFVLALSEHESLAVSLPLGPALEGAGLSCGSEARPGVITGFALTSDGLVPQMFGQSGPARGLTSPPTGLSGTAGLALLRHLLGQGLMHSSGLFADFTARPLSPLASRLARALKDGEHGRAFYLMDNLFLSGADVEELLKIKAAFSLALKLLLEAAGLAFADLSRLYLAGAFGSYVDISALESLGFIPPGASAKVAPVGNTSLAGAALLCREPALRLRLTDWAARVKALALSERDDFQRNYTRELKFEW